MSARSLVLATAVVLGLGPVYLALGTSIATPAFAEDVAIPDVETAKNSFPGIVNANAVYIRCGPAESYYPTIKIDKGTRVTVVGLKMDWLKIVPPEGSFCYIAKAYVEKRKDGSVGRVTKETVNVRAGSALNNLKVVPLCQLTQGQDVEIIGEQEEYFKIKPPANAFLYVNKQFVDPDPAAAPKPIEPIVARPVAPGPVQPTQPEASTVGTPLVPDTGTSTATPVPPGTTPPMADNTGSPATGQPNTAGAVPTTNPAVAGVPTTGPAELQAQAEQLFDETETKFAANNSKPIEEQPIAELTQAYEQLAKVDLLAPTLRRVIDSRLATLKLRADAANQLAQARVVQAAMKQKQVVLQAERAELEERLQQTKVSTYTAVGTLQSSSLQLGGQTLYRLTDPANGRTVVYLRSGDGKILENLGKFIGVKGELTTEAALSLKVITPTETAIVDPAKVNHGVASQVIPPSMIQMEASTDPR